MAYTLSDALTRERTPAELVAWARSVIATLERFPCERNEKSIANLREMIARNEAK